MRISHMHDHRQRTKALGWAAGTDDDFARQDDQRDLRFTLDAPMTITISITATDPAHFLPAFSLYAGLGDGLATPGAVALGLLPRFSGPRQAPRI